MLPTDFPFRATRWPERLFVWLLDESFLGFLAIIATALTLFPMLFTVGPGTSAAIDSVQWLIIGWFAVEYAFALAFAPDKGVFLRNPWRWIDLATILIPVATLLPGVARELRSSAILRLVRLVRVVTLGLRASGIVVRDQTRKATEVATAGPAHITLLADTPATASQPANLGELERWLGTRGEEWYHVSNPSRDDLRAVTAAAGLPAGFLENNLLGSAYPHLAAGKKHAGLFLWLPELDSTGRVDRHALFFVLWENGLLSLSRRSTQTLEGPTPPPTPDDADGPAAPFPLRRLAATVERVIRQNEAIVARFEQELHALEDVPVRDSNPEFFEKTFRLKKELSAAQSDLWRLKGVLADLAEQRVRLPGANEASAETFGRLAGSAAYLYETVLNIREEVLSVIELHLNVVSFDMNRVMRVLAVVSVLGLVPAVIGGLFGMNLVDNPWPFTLPQVAFSIGFGMLVGLYFFFVKGWLR